MITKYSIFVNVWMRLYRLCVNKMNTTVGWVHLYNLNIFVISKGMHVITTVNGIKLHNYIAIGQVISMIWVKLT
jgi:hypothetical protein